MRKLKRVGRKVGRKIKKIIRKHVLDKVDKGRSQMQAMRQSMHTGDRSLIRKMKPNPLNKRKSTWKKSHHQTRMNEAIRKRRKK